ncbi:beta-lactamase/transpeptidase-like protein [Aspergillus californicus]
MRFSIYHASTASLLFSALSFASFTPCPLLGPAFPPFSVNADDEVMANALEDLTQRLDSLVATGTGSHGDVSPNTTFSIALFSADAGDAEDEPFFWQYHHTARALNRSSTGSHSANKDSVYRIGGLTEVFTVWSLLLSGGDQILDDPVTKYLPELVDSRSALEQQEDGITYVSWEDVTVGQLASHMSGIARDYCSNEFTLQSSLGKAGLPPIQDDTKHCCGNGSKCDTDDFIRYLSSEPPVLAAGTSPSYSNMAFQLLGYIAERRAGKPFSTLLQHDIFDALGMAQTSIFAPANTSNGIIPVSKEASGWSARHNGDEASKSLFTTLTDLSRAGQAILNSTLLDKPVTNRWLKPVAHTSNPANSIGLPYVIYSGGSYPNTSMVDVYTLLSNEGYNEGLYSSYLGLVPDFGVGFAILSADTQEPADLNAHADIIGDVTLEAIITTATLQAGQNFGGSYNASHLNSSINIAYDDLPGLFIDEFISNGTDFRETLAGLAGVSDPSDLSIRLYPSQLVDGSSARQAFRAVFQDITELADNDTPTCVSWMDLDKFRYGGQPLDEFVFEIDGSGGAVNVRIPALRVELHRS